MNIELRFISAVRSWRGSCEIRNDSLYCAVLFFTPFIRSHSFVHGTFFQTRRDI